MCVANFCACSSVRTCRHRMAQCFSTFMASCARQGGVSPDAAHRPRPPHLKAGSASAISDDSLPQILRHWLNRGRAANGQGGEVVKRHQRPRRPKLLDVHRDLDEAASGAMGCGKHTHTRAHSMCVHARGCTYGLVEGVLSGSVRRCARAGQQREQQQQCCKGRTTSARQASTVLRLRRHSQAYSRVRMCALAWQGSTWPATWRAPRGVGTQDCRPSQAQFHLPHGVARCEHPLPLCTLRRVCVAIFAHAPRFGCNG